MIHKWKIRIRQMTDSYPKPFLIVFTLGIVRSRSRPSLLGQIEQWAAPLPSAEAYVTLRLGNEYNRTLLLAFLNVEVEAEAPSFLSPWTPFPLSAWLEHVYQS